MYLAKEAPKSKVLQGREDFFWEKCFDILSSMNPYLTGLLSTADVAKFSQETLMALYRNTLEGLPGMPSAPFQIVPYLKESQIQGQYNTRRALMFALHKGDLDSAITLHMCFYPSDYKDPENLLTSDNQASIEGAIEGSINLSMVTLEQTG